ncbi:MAG: RNA polymerase sigma factor [Prevotella sp.]|nr:RNA polymerase sigma factor [Prevotella sp.]
MTEEQYQEEVVAMRARLMMTARRYLTNDEAEDTVQDVLLRLWQMLPELHSPMEPLAHILVRNYSVDRLRRKRPTLQLSEVADATDSKTGSERAERIMAIISRLPAMQQTIFRLRHIEGMETRDIALLMGSTEAAVRKSLSRARQSIIRRYNDHK